jgi:hypothetical protein
MLIQEVACPDSIVAARMHPADFCNKIGTFPTCLGCDESSATGALADVHWTAQEDRL